MFPRREPRTGAAQPTALLVEYENYDEAQRAVDLLSDRGFPVQDVSIVWSGLNRIEQVVGRRTVLTALRDGALTGAWFGGLLGLLLTAFVELDEGTSAWSLVVSYMVFGSLVFGAWRAAGHWMRRGARDFDAIGRFEADHYQVWVDPDLLGWARDELGIGMAEPDVPRGSDPEHP